MARTDGHGNPPWTRDETILALDLFFEVGSVAASDTDPRVVRLSETLRAFPGNENYSRNPTFRNPAGVSFKLSNLQSVATGNGFANASKMDRAVWKQFESQRLKLRCVAALILDLAPEALSDGYETAEESEFAEGMVFTVTHRRIERNPKIRKSLINERRKTGLLCCDACGISSPVADNRFSDSIFDAHHLIPIADLGERKTKLTDMAMLCANCHKIIHRLIATHGRWVSVGDLRDAITTPDINPA